MKRTSRRTVLRSLAQGALAVALPSLVLACRSSVGPAPAVPTATAPATDLLRFGSDRTFSQVGVYIAAERGYFTDQGLEVTFAQLTGQDQIAALASGQIDCIGGPLIVGHWNALARGIAFRFVAPMARQERGASSTFLSVRKDLFDSGRFADYSDLAGKRVGVGSLPYYLLARTLEHAGLHSDAVDAVVLPDFQSLASALSSGAIDVTWLAEPTATLSANSGASVKWREIADVLPGTQSTVVMFGQELIQRRPDVAQRWMTAYLKGVRDYHAAIIKKGPGQADVVSTLTRWTPVTDASLYPQLGFAYIDPNGQLNMDSLADQLRFARNQGQVTAPLDVQQTVDMRFADAAVQRLGHFDG